MGLCRSRPITRGALELCVYGVTSRGEKVCQDHFFLSEPSDLKTVFQLVRVRNIDVVRIVIDIALPVSVEQFVQIEMVCQLLDIEMMELHYVDPSTV